MLHRAASALCTCSTSVGIRLGEQAYPAAVDERRQVELGPSRRKMTPAPRHEGRSAHSRRSSVPEQLRLGLALSLGLEALGQAQGRLRLAPGWGWGRGWRPVLRAAAEPLPGLPPVGG